MRIKSYFDSSVQTAMRQAREDFGDDVMLVTSRVASLESRHLGEYEVVFAVDEKETGPKPAVTEPVAPTALAPDTSAGFEQVFRQQFAPSRQLPAPVKARTRQSKEDAVGTIHTSLDDIGLEPILVEALIALIHSCALSGTAHVIHEPDGPSVPLSLAGAAQAEAVPDVPIEPPPHLPSDPETIEIAAKAPEVPGRTRGEQIPVHKLPGRSRNAVCGNRGSPSDRLPAGSGFVVALIALGIYGVMRRSGV